jgi:hypothetical protein
MGVRGVTLRRCDVERKGAGGVVIPESVTVASGPCNYTMLRELEAAHAL